MVHLHEYLINDHPDNVAIGINLMQHLPPDVLIDELLITLKLLKKNRNNGGIGLWHSYGKKYYSLGRLDVPGKFSWGECTWIRPIRIWSDGHINKIAYWHLALPNSNPATEPRAWKSITRDLKLYNASKTRKNTPVWRYIYNDHIPDILRSFQWATMKEFDGYSEHFDYKFNFILK